VPLITAGDTDDAITSAGPGAAGPGRRDKRRVNGAGKDTWEQMPDGYLLRSYDRKPCRRCTHMRVSHEHSSGSLHCGLCDCKWFRWPSRWWWLMWLR
jgi:hypothetical protein